jgi:Ca2+-binding EF-hand superfamily protein
MSRTRNAITRAGICLVFALSSTVAAAQSKRTSAAAARDVSQLIRMMDKDMNGAVSKQEFLDFMSRTFDRLDINRSGQLERRELRPLTTPSWPGVGS